MHKGDGLSACGALAKKIGCETKDLGSNPVDGDTCLTFSVFHFLFGDLMLVHCGFLLQLDVFRAGLKSVGSHSQIT